MYQPTAKGYFSGCGGAELGLILSGVNVVQSLDLDREAVDCMNNNSHYFSHKVLHQDIKNTTVLDQERTDIILGTYPCTAYSAIADIHGARTGDDLYCHFFRHVALEQPEMFQLENVPGMKKFPVVMEAMTKLPGYYIQVFCPVDAENWLPQRRKRLILFGTKKQFHISLPNVNRRKTLADIVEKDADSFLPDYVVKRLKGGYRDMPIIVDPEDSSAVAPTCVAHYSKDRGTRLVKDRNSRYGVRSFTVREYARLQGFPDDFKFDNKSSSFKLIGNAVPVDMGRWMGEQAMKYFN
jgi:DNA (cytosine-5)-methyltransferase 1